MAEAVHEVAESAEEPVFAAGGVFDVNDIKAMHRESAAGMQMPQRMMHAIDSFPLISIPLFMVAGELMVEGGIMDRLVDFANSVVGRVHGGLAHVAVLTGALLASVSGSAVASASAIGSSMVPSLRKYYDDGYSSAVIAAAANLGPIIPPSGVKKRKSSACTASASVWTK